MKVQVHNWQHKADNIIAALTKAGAKIVKYDPDILLIDFDAAIKYYTEKIEDAYQAGAEVALYSHGAPAILAYDMIWDPDPRSRVFLAQSEGEKTVMQAYGYPHPIEVIGWHYCRTKKFKPVKNIKGILFAPWHPHGDGYLMPQAKQANIDTYDKLKATPYPLTVMHVGKLVDNGLKHDPEVTYIQSEKNVNFSLEHIDQADVVIANLGTVASLAVARGKPMVAYGQDIRPHDGYSDEDLAFVRNWEKYRDILRYPYDISDLKPRASQHLIEHAAQYEAQEWRERFIGNQLDADKLVSVLERILIEEDDDDGKNY